MNIKFFQKIISVLIVFVCTLSIYFLIRDFNKGFDFTDESWYLLSYKYPFDATNFYSIFSIFGSLFFNISAKNIVILRFFSFIILLISILILSLSFKYNKYNFFITLKQKNINLILTIIGILSGCLFYTQFPSTPGYNYFNLLFLIFYCVLLNLYFSKKFNSNLIYFFFSIIILLISATKITTGLLTFILTVIIFKKELLNFFKIFILISLIFLGFYCFFLFENLLYILGLIKDVLFDIKPSEEISHHSFKKIFINPILPLGYYTLTNLMLLSTVVVTIISFLKKKDYNIYFCLFLIIFVFLKDRDFSIFAFYLFLYNMFLYWFIRKDNKFLFYSILLFLSLFLSFSYAFGTNNRLDHIMNLSSVIITLPLFLILFSEIKNQFYKQIFSFLFILGLSLLVYEISIERNKKPYRINFEARDNQFKVDSTYDKKLFKFLRVDQDTNKFIKNFELELKKNNWKANNYLIDTSLKSPGILLIANAKFIKYPWYLRQRNLLFNSLKHVENFDRIWFLLEKKDNNDDKILFKEIEKEFDLYDYTSSKLILQNRKFWYHKDIKVRYWYLKKPKD